MRTFGCLTSSPQGARIVLVVLLVMMASARLCSADQLQWNPLSVCKDAAAVIAGSPLLVSYCSRADADYVELWAVQGLRVSETPSPELFELVLSARLLCRSDIPYSSESLPRPKEQWTFHEAAGVPYFTTGIDLAYVYIYIGGQSFQCLGQALGLPCVVDVETIRLPKPILRGILGWQCGKGHTAFWPLNTALERCPLANH